MSHGALGPTLPLQGRLLFRGYGSLNAIGPQNLIWSGAIRRRGFVGVGVALLEEVRHLGAGIEVSCAQGTAQCLSRLPVAFKM